ncbi:MAG TPA: aspartate carbamoyltransferase catalytic subunit [Limnochordia bacterium]|nr:aspartate carbamoyltransferase catalytic subunit [Limnochordia bacterium]
MTALVSIKQLKEPDIEWLLRRAQHFVGHQPDGQMRGTVVNLFFEPSTRTALSFQMAAQRLGLTVLDFAIENSSTCKGESLVDTLKTVDALGVNAAVVRHSLDWPELIAGEKLKLSLVNAGSGHYEHPTQALLDALTIKQHFGRFADLKVAIVGDVLHSRVARSDKLLLEQLGAQVSFSGPDRFYPHDLSDCRWVDFDQALAESDVVMVLRVQHERHQGYFDVSDYNRHFGLNSIRLMQMKEDAIILHPGPVNRSVEITDDVLQNHRCKVLQQVTNGVAVRMAVMEWCFQEERREQLVSA